MAESISEMRQKRVGKPLPDPEQLRKLLRYEPETGKLYWLKRPVDLFSAERFRRIWNSRWAGQEAFTCKNRHGHFAGHLLGQKLLAHRVIWALVHGVDPKGDIDHINGRPDDNRIENLRVVTHSGNMRNQRMYRNNKSGVTGVYWLARENKYRAFIKVNNRTRYLGCFDTLGQAAKARKAAEKKYGFHENHGRAS